MWRISSGFDSMVYIYIFFFDKETSDSGIKMRIFQKKNKLKGCTNKLLQNLKKVKYAQLL